MLHAVEVEDRLLAIKEAAFQLGDIGRDSVVRLIRKGELGCIEFPKMGGTGKNVKRMIPQSEIKRFKERRANIRKPWAFFE